MKSIEICEFFRFNSSFPILSLDGERNLDNFCHILLLFSCLSYIHMCVHVCIILHYYVLLNYVSFIHYYI